MNATQKSITMERYVPRHSLPLFDLFYVMKQMRESKQYADWTPERFLRAEANYRIFLATCKDSTTSVIPTRDVDEVWHRHILNTVQYIADCNAYFGHYLHHQPGPPKPDAICFSEYVTTCSSAPGLAAPTADEEATCSKVAVSGDEVTCSNISPEAAAAVGRFAIVDTGPMATCGKVDGDEPATCGKVTCGSEPTAPMYA